MPFMRKYNTLLVTGTTSIRIPIIKRAVVDFAVGADWTPAAGDVKVFVDAAAAANITNLPTAIASGNGAFWEFIITAAELTCKQLLVVVADAATKAIEDQSFIVETYGNASAMYAADLSLANLPANVTQLLGTAWLTPGVAGTPDVNAKQLGAAPVTATTSVTFSAASTVASTTNITAATGVDITKILGTTIATPATAGILDVNTKNINNVAAATPGATNGILISGSNAGTTTLGALTVTGATTYTGATVHTGNVSMAAGLTVTQSTANTPGVDITGNGSGAGLRTTGGAAVTTTPAGPGLTLVGGASSTGAGGVAGVGLVATGGAGSASVNGAVEGMKLAGGGTNTVASNAHGLNIVGASTGHGLLTTSGAGATGDGMRATAASTNGHGLSLVKTGTGSDLNATVTPLVLAKTTNLTGLNDIAATAVVSSGAITTSGGAVTTVTTTTNLTNLPTIPANWLTAAGTATDFGAELATAIWSDTVAGDFTVALSVGKSVMNGVALGTGLTINAYTGNTVQTGDSFARIGAAGAGLTAIDLPNQTMDIVGNITGNLSGSVGSVTGAVGSVTGLTAANLDATISSRATPAQVKTQMTDALNVDTYAEPGQGTPLATTTLVGKIGYLFKNWRNRQTQTSTTWSLFNDDALTVDQKATVADDATTASKTEIATGP